MFGLQTIYQYPVREWTNFHRKENTYLVYTLLQKIYCLQLYNAIYTTNIRKVLFTDLVSNVGSLLIFESIQSSLGEGKGCENIKSKSSRFIEVSNHT